MERERAACPGLDELWSGAAAEHARDCGDCRALVELAGDALPCGVAEALLAARATGPLAPERARLLDAHLARCMACGLVASSLDPPTLAGAAEPAGNLDDLGVVDADLYVRGLEIGRGGMGQIVRARDRRLGRMVAIKELIDPRLRARFEHEARLTARLQHPAIVPVYEAGRWPNGEPFYAMKYVAGQPLDGVVAGLAALDDRLALLSHVTAVVEAIAYAHSEGVIHRDLKPQNILIGRFGETVVIDWGLAKELRAAGAGAPFRSIAADAGALTRSGAGTPAYMAPEQARGAPPDERVDVFALGATLHHVLAGDRPDLRALPDATPPELRAIITKATAGDPAARYPSAAELAGELKRFQNGQLVAAHRYTSSELVRRWLRRHRAVVAVTTIALLVLTAGGALGVRRVVAERDRANLQRQGAERLVDYMLGTLHDRLQPVGKLDLLAGVGKQIEGYFASVPDGDVDAEVLRRRGRGLLQLARIDRDKDQLPDARAEYERALALCRRAERIAPAPASAACIGQALSGLGVIQGMTGAHGLAQLDEARRLLDAALARAPGDPELRKVRAEIPYAVGIEQEMHGAIAAARATMLAGLPFAQALADDLPRDVIAIDKLAVLHAELCHIENLNGQPDAAVRHGEQEAALRARQHALQPDHPLWAVMQASGTVDVAEAADQMGDWRAARAALAPAMVALRRNVDQDRENLVRQEHLAEASLVACEIQLDATDRPPGEDACAETEALFGALVLHNPDRTTPAINLASTEIVHATLQLGRGELAAARTTAARAAARAEAWLARTPADHVWRQLLGTAKTRLASIAHAAGQADEARAQARQAIAAVAPTKDDYQNDLARRRAELVLAELEGEAGDRSAAEVRVHRVLGELVEATRGMPHIVEFERQRALAVVLLAELTADAAEAHALRSEAIQRVSALADRDALGIELHDLPARARRGAPR